MPKITKKKTSSTSPGGVRVDSTTKTVVRKGLGGRTITRTKTKNKLFSPKGTNNAGKDVRAKKTFKTRTVSKGDNSSLYEKTRLKSNVDNLQYEGDTYNKKKRTSKYYDSPSTGKGYFKPFSHNETLSDTLKFAKQRRAGNRLK